MRYQQRWVRQPYLNLHFKRVLDIVASAAGTVLLAPVMVVVALAIWVEDRRSPLFRQQRVGRHGEPFTIVKFRTMHVGSAEVPTHLADVDCISRVGAFLRSTKLDELPQLINVARGEMSLVGPRPCLPSQHEVIAARARNGVLSVRPGITGLAQIAGMDMSDPDSLANADAEYRQRCSLLLDLLCIVRTVIGQGAGDAVVIEPHGVPCEF